MEEKLGSLAAHHPMAQADIFDPTVTVLVRIKEYIEDMRRLLLPSPI